MDLKQIFELFSQQNIFSITFKVVAIFFSFFYLLYAIVIAKQIQVMNKTLETKRKDVFVLISAVQTAVAVIILILAIFLI